MHHDLVRILRRIGAIPLAPIIADSIREDIPIAIERRC